MSLYFKIKAHDHTVMVPEVSSGLGGYLQPP